MLIVQKVNVYSDYCGEEELGLVVFRSEDIPGLAQYYDAAKVCAQVRPQPNFIKFYEYTPTFYGVPDLYDISEKAPDIFDDLENDRCVFVEDLSIFGIGDENIARTEAVTLRIFTDTPNDFMWGGYLKHSNIQFETAGFYLDELIQEINAYESAKSNQGSEAETSCQ